MSYLKSVSVAYLIEFLSDIVHKTKKRDGKFYRALTNTTFVRNGCTPVVLGKNEKVRLIKGKLANYKFINNGKLESISGEIDLHSFEPVEVKNLTISDIFLHLNPKFFHKGNKDFHQSSLYLVAPNSNFYNSISALRLFLKGRDLQSEYVTFPFLPTQLPREIISAQEVLVYFDNPVKPSFLSNSKVLTLLEVGFSLNKPIHTVMTLKQQIRAYEDLLSTPQDFIARLPKVEDLTLRKLLAHHVSNLMLSAYYFFRRRKDTERLKLASLANHTALFTYYAKGNPKIPKKLIMQALKIYSKTLGPHHEFCATLFYNFFIVAKETGVYPRNKLLKPLKRTRINEVESLIELAGVYADSDNFSLAEEVYHKAVTTAQQEGNVLHTIVGLNNLAEMLNLRRRSSEARVLYNQALYLLRNSELDQNHTMLLMAQIYSNLGGMDEYYNKKAHVAGKSYLKSLKLLQVVDRNADESFEIKMNPLIDQNITNLATFLYINQDFKESERYLKQSIKLRIIEYGTNYEALTQQLQNLASLLLNRRNNKKAGLKVMLKAFDIFNDSLGSDHPRTKQCKKLVEQQVS
eukprot:snap_masked-scaffold_1-processed-gene-25.24-mRNA-1 protein AED:1.00 eAED:1.00 QI:0/-1/0/0/-1/1/1/0/574